MNYQKILLFLVLTFGLSWLGWHIPGWFMSADNLLLPFLQLGFYSWGPGLAAILVQRLVYRESLRGLGWNRKYFSLRWIALALLAPIGLIVGSLGLTYLLGNVMHLPGFGEVVLSAPVVPAAQGPSWLNSQLPNTMSLQGLPPEIGGLLMMLLTVSLISGATLSLLWLSGQELGWRGFMLVETRSLGFLGSNLIIGGLWGLWIFPLFWLQLIEPLPLWELFGHLLSIVGFGVAMAFPTAWLAIRTRSIYAPATLLGVFNNLAPIALFFTFDLDPRLGSPEGLAGMFMLLIATFFILRFDKRMIDGYDHWVY